MNLRENPVKPFLPQGEKDIVAILEEMEGVSFQGRNLGTSFRIWKEMLEDRTFIFLGLAGAMVPAGMRKIISFLISNRLIDCLVSTGANLFHDCHESLGRMHYRTSPFLDDVKLKEAGMDRIYDTLASEEDFQKTDQFIQEFARTLDRKRYYSTREFLYYLGEKLSKKGKEEGILTSAYRSKIPLYCPAMGDSSLGIALVAGKISIKFDLLKDVEETAYLAGEAEKTGVIYIGGGTPKNFIQQTQVTLSVKGKKSQGHFYAIQIITDAPHWGGLSGATLEEAQSWGKISARAKKVTLYCDATIALPLLAQGLARAGKRGLKRPSIPQFEPGEENIRIKG
jgi:deoxyhypusine synthase